MKLDDLRQLDLRNMPDWPIRAQLAVAFSVMLLMVVAGYVLILQEPIDKLSAARNQEILLRQTYVDKLRAAQNLAEQEKQLNAVQSALAQLIRQLPTRANMASLLADINQAGATRNLRFELFRPENETINGELAEVPISLRVTGSYQELTGFAADLAHLPRIVSLSDLTLLPAKSGKLTLQARLRTFRALDANERAALQAPRTPEKKGKKSP